MASIFQQILTLSCDFVPVFKFGRLWLWRWHPRSTSLLYFSHYWCVNCHCGQQFLQPRNKNAHSCGGRPQTETELCLSETVNAARPCAACAAPGSVHRKRPCCIPHHDFLLLICSRDALILNDRHVWWCSNSTVNLLLGFICLFNTGPRVSVLRVTSSLGHRPSHCWLNTQDMQVLSM